MDTKTKILTMAAAAFGITMSACAHAAQPNGPATTASQSAPAATVTQPAGGEASCGAHSCGSAQPSSESSSH